MIALRGEGLKNAEIEKQIGFKRSSIPRIVRTFKAEGFEGLTKKQAGGSHRTVSLEEEEKFLASYREKSQKTEILISKEMWLDFQETFQVTVNQYAFYFLLHRHGWRKVKLRPQRPKKADAQTIQASKKLTEKFDDR